MWSVMGKQIAQAKKGLFMLNLALAVHFLSLN